MKYKDRMITNRANDFSNLNFNEGEIIFIDKPSGWTSFKVVNRMRRAINVKKVGHAGTLDPLATGLLIVATGKKTKELGIFQELNKTYCGTILLGKRSPSMDLETKCEDFPIPKSITEELILSVRDRFLGNVEQITPMYSAAKVMGKRLYKLARLGKSVDRKTRKIFIERFEITSIDIPEIKFEITCSKGTYIRVIANDFGEELGCGAVLSKLRRTKIGELSVKDAFTVNDFLYKYSSTSVESTLPH